MRDAWKTLQIQMEIDIDRYQRSTGKQDGWLQAKSDQASGSLVLRRPRLGHVVAVELIEGRIKVKKKLFNVPEEDLVFNKTEEREGETVFQLAGSMKLVSVAEVSRLILREFLD